MPNNPPSNLVVNFLVFQAPDIFHFKQFTVNCFTVAIHPSLLWIVTGFFQNHYTTPCILSFWQLPDDCLVRGMKLRVANKWFWPSSSLRICIIFYIFLAYFYRLKQDMYFCKIIIIIIITTLILLLLLLP